MTATGGFVAYYRVSTRSRGALPERRRLADHRRVHGGGERTAQGSLRTGAALAAARLHRVPLVVAKVDRLINPLGRVSLASAGGWR